MLFLRRSLYKTVYGRGFPGLEPFVCYYRDRDNLIVPIGLLQDGRRGGDGCVPFGDEVVRQKGQVNPLPRDKSGKPVSRSGRKFGEPTARLIKLL
jgi:hypothetical protein